MLTAPVALGRSQQLFASEPIVENTCVPALRLTAGWCGDGGWARLALAWKPFSVAALADGSFAFTDQEIAAVRRVTPDGHIERVAGTGDPGDGGDGGPAVRARISAAGAIAATADGGFLLADRANHRVRQVSPEGRITTVAGTGQPGFSGDGGAATRAQLRKPASVAPLPGGGFLIADRGNHRVRRVDAEGVIATAAGTGSIGYSGDGGPAAVAQLGWPQDVAALPDGGYVIVDVIRPRRHGALLLIGRLRRVTALGRIDTILKRDEWMTAIEPAPDGSLVVVSDWRIWRLDRNGVLTSVTRRVCPAASPWIPVRPRDGGPASRARLAASDVETFGDGSLLVSDWMFSRVRRIGPLGRITTAAGGGGRSGRILMTDQPCGGASPSYPPWNMFRIVRVRPTRSGAAVRFATSLAARVTLTARRRGRAVRKRRLRVVANFHTIRVGLQPGRYRLVLRGRHRELRRVDSRTLRVR